MLAKCHVGELSCWQNVMLAKCHVSKLSCWRIVMLANCHVRKLSCWWIVMLANYHVGKLSCWRNIMVACCKLVNCNVGKLSCWQIVNWQIVRAMDNFLISHCPNCKKREYSLYCKPVLDKYVHCKYGQRCVGLCACTCALIGECFGCKWGRRCDWPVCKKVIKTTSYDIK
jgi:hypothetical protein